MYSRPARHRASGVHGDERCGGLWARCTRLRWSADYLEPDAPCALKFGLSIRERGDKSIEGPGAILHAVHIGAALAVYRSEFVAQRHARGLDLGLDLKDGHEGDVLIFRPKEDMGHHHDFEPAAERPAVDVRPLGLGL
jgi:hypothetical protein